MSDFGFELEEEKVEVKEDNFDPIPPKVPRCQTGDIFQLGEHRLMVGDSTKVEDVDRLVGGG